MKRYDVCTPRKKKDGGTFWHRVGTAFEGERGISILFDSLPLPDAEGRCAVNLFEPREGGSQSARKPQPDNDAINDEMPF